MYSEVLEGLPGPVIQPGISARQQLTGIHSYCQEQATATQDLNQL